MFFFYGFCSSAHFSFVSSKMFWYTLVFATTEYILKQKWYIEKDKTLEAVYLLKVSNNDTTGITVQSETIWLCFCVPIDTSDKCYKYRYVFITYFEHFFLAKPSILFSIIFIKQIFFTFLDLLTLIFLLYSHCSKCTRE